jgi:hypothetical protein
MFKGLTISKILRFVSLAAKLKDDILLTQPKDVPTNKAPDFLPPSIEAFLSSSCSLLDGFVGPCWEIFKETVWEGRDLMDTDEEAVFKEHGYHLGISKFPLLLSALDI